MLVGERVDEEMVAKAVSIAWAIWNNRNEIRTGGKRRTSKEVVRWATQYMEYNVTTKCMANLDTLAEVKDVWAPNVNGAVFTRQKAVGIGVIIRDDKGRIEAAMSKKINAPLGAVEVEAMAYEIGLVFAKDIGIQDFIIDGVNVYYVMGFRPSYITCTSYIFVLHSYLYCTHIYLYRTHMPLI